MAFARKSCFDVTLCALARNCVRLHNDRSLTILDVKAALSMAQVLRHYHLKPDKKHRLSCPFHEDRMPSMQVYHKTHTAYCFSGNCPTHGRSLDVIDFVMHKES